jgi:membrane protein DedA with SNARE-associated domain
VIEALIAQYGYLAIFVGTLLEGETILVLGGLAAHRGLLSLPGVMAAACAGSLTSDQVMFQIGRRRGSAWLARRPTWHAAVARVQHLIARHEVAVIVGFRFLYGLRNVTPVVLGMSRVSTARFAALNAVGAVVWAIAVTLLGWWIGAAAQQLVGRLEHYERGIAIGVAAIGIAAWCWRRAALRRSVRPHADTAARGR